MGGGGLVSPSSNKVVCWGGQGALKIGQVVVNAFRKRFSLFKTLSLSDIFASSGIEELID